MKNIPFSIFASAPFPGARRISGAPNPVGPLDMYEVDEGIAALGCAVDVPLPESVCPAGEIQIRISKLSDLKPHNLVQNNDYLSRLKGALDFVVEHRTDLEVTSRGLRERFGDLPLDLSVIAPAQPETVSTQSSLLDSLFSKIDLSGNGGVSDKLGVEAQLEDMLKTALSAVFRDPEFRQLESTLRGVELLVKQGPIKRSAKTTLTLCPTGRDDLEEVLRRIVRNSAQYPPSLVLVDRPLGNTFADVDALETMANFSEAVTVPTVVQLAPSFFGQDAWNGIADMGYLSTELGAQPYAKLRTLKAAPESRWLAPVLPEVCGRIPYGRDEAARPVAFRETETTWISAVWAVGAFAVQSQAAFGWPSRLTDHARFRVEQPVAAKEGGKNSPLRVLFSEDRVNQLNEIGAACLRSVPNSTEVFLHRAPNLTGGTLGYQLFANRILCFFYQERERLADHPEIRTSKDLVESLQTRFEAGWAETETPLPEDLQIGVAHADRNGQVVLSIRMTPSASLVPQPKLLEFEMSFAL